MAPGQPSTLQMPSFLHGIYSAVDRETLKEGQRCAEQYRQEGAFPPPHELRGVSPGEGVVAHEVVDFQRERPAWRLYMLSGVMTGLCEALDWQNATQVRDAYEAACRETAWGALYFATSRVAPKSAERTAPRLRAVLRFWELLQSARYLYSTPSDALTLEELMVASCDWAMEAWCPVGGTSVRARLEQAAERMARATREDSIEAILRQMPRALTSARDLKHRNLLADPAFLRERLTTLGPAAFEHISGAWTAMLIRQLHIWDRQLANQ